jgi:hypothetical protein
VFKHFARSSQFIWNRVVQTLVVIWPFNIQHIWNYLILK